jgi:predicted DNA-binding transcriptional regulator YafY
MERVKRLLASGRVKTSGQMAEQIGCCKRSIQRYVTRLRAAGMHIESERGVGYMLRARKEKLNGQINGL